MDSSIKDTKDKLELHYLPFVIIQVLYDINFYTDNVEGYSLEYLVGKLLDNPVKDKHVIKMLISYYMCLDNVSIKQLVDVFKFGEKKYIKYGWVNIEKRSMILDAFLRHYILGDTKDEESGISHKAFTVANLAMLYYLIHNNISINDIDYNNLTKE